VAADRLESLLRDAFPDADELRVEDRTGGGDHFRARVVAPEFSSMSRIEQHRRVYSVFGAEIGGPIHALSLETRAE